MAKISKLTRKARSRLRRSKEIAALVELDLDFHHSWTDKEIAEFLKERIEWRVVAPSKNMLDTMRKSDEYVELRERTVKHSGLADKVQAWAGQLFAQGEHSVLQGYREIIEGGPKEYKSLWLKAAQDVKAMAGLRDSSAEPGKEALAFIQGLGIGIGQKETKLSLIRQDDGTIVEGEVRELN